MGWRGGGRKIDKIKTERRLNWIERLLLWDTAFSVGGEMYSLRKRRADKSAHCLLYSIVSCRTVVSVRCVSPLLLLRCHTVVPGLVMNVVVFSGLACKPKTLVVTGVAVGLTCCVASHGWGGNNAALWRKYSRCSEQECLLTLNLTVIYAWLAEGSFILGLNRIGHAVRTLAQLRVRIRVRVRNMNSLSFLLLGRKWRVLAVNWLLHFVNERGRKNTPIYLSQMCAR